MTERQRRRFDNGTPNNAATDASLAASVAPPPKPPPAQPKSQSAATSAKARPASVAFTSAAAESRRKAAASGSSSPESRGGGSVSFNSSDSRAVYPNSLEAKAAAAAAVRRPIPPPTPLQRPPPPSPPRRTSLADTLTPSPPTTSAPDPAPAPSTQSQPPAPTSSFLTSCGTFYHAPLSRVAPSKLLNGSASTNESLALAILCPTSAGARLRRTATNSAPETRDTTEIIHILSGRRRIIDSDDRVHEFKRGDTVVLPRGWRGRVEIVEDVHDVWFVHDHDKDYGGETLAMTVNAHGRRGRDRHPRHEKWEMLIVAACSVQTGND